MDTDSGYRNHLQLNRQQEILRNVGLLSLAGTALFAIVFCAPDAEPRLGAFYQPALQTTWRHVVDVSAVWSSVKIILFSAGLFLWIESTGTMLALLKLKAIALPVYFLQILPCICLFCGLYYLVKSVL